MCIIENFKEIHIWSLESTWKQSIWSVSGKNKLHAGGAKLFAEQYVHNCYFSFHNEVIEVEFCDLSNLLCFVKKLESSVQ